MTMKHLFFFCCLMSACVYAGGDTLEDFSLKGPVIEVEEDSRRVPPGSRFEEGERLSGRRLVFDGNGNLLTEEWSGPSGGYTTVIGFSYDTAGRLAERVFSQADMAVPDRTVYTWNDKGLPEEIVHTFTVGTYGWIYRHTYDPAGRLAEKRKFELSGTPVSILRYSYDGTGRVVEERLLDRRERTLSYVRYEYGPDRVAREIAPDGVHIVSKRTTLYNEHGDPSVVRTELSSGRVLPTRSVAYIYDDAGNWTERSEEDSGRRWRIVTRRRIAYGTSDEQADGEGE